MAESGVQMTAGFVLEPHIPRGTFALDFTPSTAKHCHGAATLSCVLQSLGIEGTTQLEQPCPGTGPASK